jgi:hypothetical protein
MDNPLRPVQVYFGTMNVSTRYADPETVQLWCGVPEAIQPLAALARKLGGVAVVKQGEVGIDVLDALIPASALLSMARVKGGGGRA